MSAPHTPWTVKIPDDGHDSIRVRDKDAFTVALVTGGLDADDDRLNGPTTIANAHRIVACVNACEGLADPSVVAELLDACQCVLELDQVADILSGNETLRDLLEDVVKKAKAGR